MAISPGLVTGVWGITEVSGPRPTHTIAGHEYEIEKALVSVNHNNQSIAYAQADGTTFDPSAALLAYTGRVCTAIQACCVEAGEDAGTLTLGGTAAAPITVSGAGVVHAHLYVEDTTTQRAGAGWGAANTWTKDVVYCITYLKLIA